MKNLKFVILILTIACAFSFKSDETEKKIGGVSQVTKTLSLPQKVSQNDDFRQLLKNLQNLRAQLKDRFASEKVKTKAELIEKQREIFPEFQKNKIFQSFNKLYVGLYTTFPEISKLTFTQQKALFKQAMRETRLDLNLKSGTSIALQNLPIDCVDSCTWLHSSAIEDAEANHFAATQACLTEYWDQVQNRCPTLYGGVSYTDCVSAAMTARVECELAADNDLYMTYTLVNWAIDTCIAYSCH